MKAAVILAIGLTGFAVAQNTLPTCAQKCVDDATVSAGCTVGDLQCSCGPKNAAIATAATPCLLQQSGCSATDLLTAQSVGAKICSDYLATASGSGTMTSTSSSAPAPTSNATVTTAVNNVTATSTPTPSPSKAGSSGAASLAISAAGALAAIVVLAASL